MKTTTSVDEKKLDREMDKWAKKQYAGKLVNLFTEKPIQFDKKTVYRTMEKLNSGKEVSKKTLVKMLYQLQYMIPEYQSLVFLMDRISKNAKEYSDYHSQIAYLEKRNK